MYSQIYKYPCRVDGPISINLSNFASVSHVCKIEITLLNNKSHSLSPSFWNHYKFQRQHSLPIHIHSTGQPDYHNQRQNLRWNSALFKEPKFVPFWHTFFHHTKCYGFTCVSSWLFHHIRKWQLHVWNFTTLEDFVYLERFLSSIIGFNLSSLLKVVMIHQGARKTPSFIICK